MFSKMVNWYAVGLAATLFYIFPKRFIYDKIRNYCTYRALTVPPKTVIVILDDIGLNYEKTRQWAKKGARVILGGKNRLKLDTARYELVRSTKNKNILTIYVNRHDKHSLEKFADEISTSEITVEALVNNSGKELTDLDIIFKTQELARERFENHCRNFLFERLPEIL